VNSLRTLAAVTVVAALAASALADDAKPRARDLGIPFDGTPGPLNGITDVPGVEVGHSTIIQGEGARVVGVGPIRTGVTAVFPRGLASKDPVFAGVFSLNGNGEMTGAHWLDEFGVLQGPIMLTNTHSVGSVYEAVIAWCLKEDRQPDSEYCWSLPIVAETWDGELNDANGFHVHKKHAFEAIESARSGPVQEGNVGGGTGMICHDFKGGIGTASRVIKASAGGHTVGVLVQCNYGLREQLRIAGVPVGRELSGSGVRVAAETGSIIIVVATDAPLLPHQLKRMARRAALGLARNGSISGSGSGDIFVAFSNANAGAVQAQRTTSVSVYPSDNMDPLFEATVEATEEAIINAMIAAQTMIGADGITVRALPQDRVREILRKYNRLVE
jgi:L-aminopeptidase/D-esterase-like protein